MKPRICGIETEYGMLFRDKSGRWCSPDKAPTGKTLRDKAIEYLNEVMVAPRFPKTTPDLQYTANGARIYSDVGHIEYATPECIPPQQVVAADCAGSRVLQKMFSDFSPTHKIVFLKENVSCADMQGTSVTHFACHESYSFDENPSFRMPGTDAAIDLRLNWIMPFFVTRQLVSGAGIFAFGEFLLSARSMFIDKRFGTAANGEYCPIVLTRGDTDMGKIPRLQLTLGDANMSEISGLLKMGTTALVLNLLEDGYVPKEWAFSDEEAAVKMIRRIAHDPTGCADTMTLLTGEQKTALKIQRQFFNLAAHHYPDHSAPPYLQRAAEEILQWWDYVLCRLESGMTEELVGILDWPTKYMLARQFLKPYGISLETIKDVQADPKDSRRTKILYGLRSMEQSYHRIGSDGYYEILKKRGVMRTIIPEKLICSLMTVPPQRTRAWARGNAIRFARFLGPEKVRITSADWHRVTVEWVARNGTTVAVDFDLSDPFVPFPLSNEKFFRTMAQMYAEAVAKRRGEKA